MMNIKIRYRCFFRFLILAFLLISVSSLAAISAPPWRGNDKTVYAEWNTWTYRTTYAGDFIFSPDQTAYGQGKKTAVVPQAVQLASPIGGNPVQVLGSYNGRQEVLKVNRSGLYVNLPNFLDEDYTLLRFVISYHTQYASFTGFDVWGLTGGGALPGYNGDFIVPDLVAGTYDNGWATEVYQFTIRPSPLWESIVIKFSHYPNTPQEMDAPYIDYFYFDTICLPEPSALFLLAAGGILVRRPNRK